MKLHNKLLLAAVSLIGIAILFFFIQRGHYFFTNQPPSKNQTYYELQHRSADFSKCTKLIEEERFKEAQEFCKRAYDVEQDTWGKYYTIFTYALSLTALPADNLDDMHRAITMLKDLVKNPEVSVVLKAQCVRVMDMLYFTSVAVDVHRMIIEDEPYRSFANSPDMITGIIKLLEYGESFYPLANIEMRLANLHSHKLLLLNQELEKNPTNITLPAKIEREKLIIREAILKGERSIRALESLPGINSIPLVLLNKAIASQNYYFATGQTPFGDPETIFQEALELAKNTLPTKVEGISFFYALYLAKTSSAERDRTSEVRSFLKEIYGNPNSTMTSLLQKERKNTIGLKGQIISLATIDTEFKQYLMSLGWQEEDFRLSISSIKQQKK